MKRITSVAIVALTSVFGWADVPADWTFTHDGREISYVGSGPYMHMATSGFQIPTAHYYRFMGDGTVSHQWDWTPLFIEISPSMTVIAAEPSGGVTLVTNGEYGDFGSVYEIFSCEGITATGQRFGLPSKIGFEADLKAEMVAFGKQLRVSVDSWIADKPWEGHFIHSMRGVDPTGVAKEVGYYANDYGYYPHASAYSQTGTYAVMFDQNLDVFEYHLKQFRWDGTLIYDRVIPFSFSKMVLFPGAGADRKGAQVVEGIDGSHVRRLKPDASTDWDVDHAPYTYLDIRLVPTAGIMAFRKKTVGGTTTREIIRLDGSTATDIVTLPDWATDKLEFHVDASKQLFVTDQYAGGYRLRRQIMGTTIGSEFDFPTRPRVDGFNNLYWAKSATQFACANNLMDTWVEGKRRNRVVGGETNKVHAHLRFVAPRDARTAVVTKSGSSHLTVGSTLEFTTGDWTHGYNYYGHLGAVRFYTTPVTAPETATVTITYGGKSRDCVITILPRKI